MRVIRNIVRILGVLLLVIGLYTLFHEGLDYFSIGISVFGLAFLAI